jgi:hypothetical protein
VVQYINQQRGDGNVAAGDVISTVPIAQAPGASPQPTTTTTLLPPTQGASTAEVVAAPLLAAVPAKPSAQTTIAQPLQPLQPPQLSTAASDEISMALGYLSALNALAAKAQAAGIWTDERVQWVNPSTRNDMVCAPPPPPHKHAHMHCYPTV